MAPPRPAIARVVKVGATAGARFAITNTERGPRPEARHPLERVTHDAATAVATVLLPEEIKQGSGLPWEILRAGLESARHRRRCVVAPVVRFRGDDRAGDSRPGSGNPTK
jgi:hypothetical protein